MLNIIERLDRQEFTPSICIQRRGGKLEVEIERQGISLLEAPFTTAPRPYTTLPYRCWKLAQTFRPHGFKLWHSFHYSDDYTEPLIARFAGCRNWIYTKKNMMWRGRAWKVRTYLARAIAAQNQDMLRDFFAADRTRRKVSLVPRGVDIAKFSVNGSAMKEAAPDGLVTVTCVAQLVPRKGHPMLLEAAARNSRIVVQIAGAAMDEQYTEQLERQVQALGIPDRVRFLGPVADVVSLLHNSDIFALPTNEQAEGCPVALLEAMACGLPCVATDVPGSRDVIESGVNGLLTPAGDAERFAHALDSVVADPALRATLGSNARRRVEEHYHLGVEVARHEAIYHSLLGERV